MTLRALVFWLSLAQLISWGSLYYTFSLLLQPLEAEFGFSRAQSSLALSIALLMEGVMAFWVGRLIDKGHGRAVMLCGTLLAGTALFAHSLMFHGFQLYALWALIGCSFACTLYAPAFAILTQRYPTDYRRAITGLTFLGGLASTVFIPLSAWLIRELGWRHALQVLASLQLLICLPIHWWVLRPNTTLPSTSDQKVSKPRTVLLPLLKTRPFLFLAAFMGLSSFVSSGLPAHLIPLLRERGLTEAVVLLIPASIGVLQVIGRLLLFVFEKHLNLHTSNRLIVGLMPIGVLILAVGGQTLLPC